MGANCCRPLEEDYHLVRLPALVPRRVIYWHDFEGGDELVIGTSELASGEN